MRDTVLLSHANPEDNEFTQWLALQLASEGYRVWSDVTKLLGGEVFWDDIEAVIRDRAVKVVFVLSRTSNSRDGVLRELHLAQHVAKQEKLKDFVIPVRVDDISFSDITIELTRVIAIDFQASWAEGFSRLLAKLGDHSVPKDPSFNRDSVTSWWRNQYASETQISQTPEVLISNWYRVEQLPDTIYDHKIGRRKPGPFDLDTGALPYPGVWLNDAGLLTFAESKDLQTYLFPYYEVVRSREITFADFIAGEDVLRSGRKYVSQLLRMAWEAALDARLARHQMANGHICYWFTKGLNPKDIVHFTSVDGRRTYRAMVGYKTLATGKLRYWHYGISAGIVIRPETLIVIRGHVLFSDDGKTPWDSKSATARARRNQCKNWWNDEWRDRLSAAIDFLSEGQDCLSLPLGASRHCRISKSSVEFLSPVTYVPPTDVVKDDDGYDLDDNDDPDLEIT